jgi:hypothetical protein
LVVSSNCADQIGASNVDLPIAAEHPARHRL